MCRYWGVNASVVRNRLRAGKTLSEALTLPCGQVQRKPSSTCKPCRDHEGVEYPSLTAMCRRWRVLPATFQARRNRGMSLEDALTTRTL